MGQPNLRGMVGGAQDCTAISPEDELAKQEYWQIVEAALSPKQFQAVQMYFRESLTQEDIAERLGMSQQGACKFLQQAIARLAKPKTRSLLERAIPAARKPPVVGHRALHAYQVAEARDESNVEEDWGADSPEEVRADRRQHQNYRAEHGAWAEEEHAPAA